ncbi:MAG: hypothetical protein MJE77_46390 [Proteobacteria bacterium]|nr:hypothetical protein [Pseudomonadota bacterium]
MGKSRHLPELPGRAPQRKSPFSGHIRTMSRAMPRIASGRRLFLIVLGVVAAGAMATCIEDPAVVCADGRLCAPGTVCSPTGDCVVPEQIDDCRDRDDFTTCSYPGVPDGVCTRGVCIPHIPLCGDGVVDRDFLEACDEGRANSNEPDAACRPNCQPGRCGDGIRDSGEVCDDGNLAASDGCTPDCESDEMCGNGYVDFLAGELCDDGNRLNHDGCASRCVPEVPTWTERALRPPSPRHTHAMAYDAARGRIVRFGGLDARGYYDDYTWEWDGIRWTQVPTASSPPGRTDHAMVYDAARSRVVLFGGLLGRPGNDTWEWDGARWSLVPTVAAPPPRTEHAMAYQAARGRVVLFGGYGPAGQRDDTWEWDGARWTVVSPDRAPPARWGHAMAYDPIRDRVVLFGGQNRIRVDATCLNDTWEWDGARWTLAASSTSPPARQRHAMTYDAVRGRIIMFGGEDDNRTSLGDSWEWDGASWTPISTTIAPTATNEHAMAHDAVRGRVVLFGGYGGGRDTWEWDGARWVLIATAQSSPSPRFTHATAYHAARGRLVLFGGRETDYTPLDDTWEWDGEHWALVATTQSPSARWNHAMAYDAVRDRIVLFGGEGDSDTLLDDTWEWDGARWTLIPADRAPSPRSEHAMAYDATRGRVVLFGGYNGVFPPDLDDTWEWDGARWTRVLTVTSPPPRYASAMVYDAARGRTVLFGGFAGTIYNDTWEWDGAFWTGVSTATAPAPRVAHGMTYDAARGRVLLFGGTPGLLTATWEWDGAGWTLVPTDSAPMDRTDHALAYDAARGRVVLFGGYGDGGPSGDTWYFRYQHPTRPVEACLYGFDTDGDALIGCQDPDCWGYCAPHCPPGASCDPAAPHCGDGVCNPHLETCRLCPGDCGPCSAVCGDFHCDPGETANSCPGDCRTG